MAKNTFTPHILTFWPLYKKPLNSEFIGGSRCEANDTKSVSLFTQTVATLTELMTHFPVLKELGVSVSKVVH